MKVLHVPYSFYPDAVGGTEVYVRSLAQQLQTLGVSAVVAAPGNNADAYTHEGVRVHRYVTGQVNDLITLYGEGDDNAARAFNQIMAIEQPDIVHLHAFTRGVSLLIARAAKKRRVPVVFTYHTPTVTCQRGTMMHWGTEPCAGLMELRTCSRCAVQGLFEHKQNLIPRSLSLQFTRTLAKAFGSLSPAFGSLLARIPRQGGLWTALRMPELIQLRHTTVRDFLSEVDHVVAVSQWVKETLIRNGVSEEKIMLSRQGVFEECTAPDLHFPRSSRPLNVAFLGRLDPTKGLDILIQAFRRIAGAPLQLHIFGITQGKSGHRYEQILRHIAAGDHRIEFRSPVPSSDVIMTLRKYDLLAVPSQWLETGPLVVLEAFAAGIPVIGSRRGGIREIVRDGIDGILVEPDDVKGWSSVLLQLSADRSLIQALRRNIRPPKTMVIAAREMATLYKQILNRNVEVSSAVASSL